MQLLLYGMGCSEGWLLPYAVMISLLYALQAAHRYAFAVVVEHSVLPPLAHQDPCCHADVFESDLHGGSL